MKLLSFSIKPWSKIESDCLRDALSSPVQFYITYDNVIDKICKDLCLPEVFVRVVVESIDMHYKSYGILRHIVGSLIIDSSGSVLPICSR